MRVGTDVPTAGDVTNEWFASPATVSVVDPTA